MDDFKNLDKIKENIDNEFKDFLKAMTRLAHGHVNTSVNVNLKNIDRDSFIHRNYIEIINLMIENLKNAKSEFNKITDVHSRRLLYVGGDLYNQGEECAHKMAKLIENQGKVAITTAHLNSTGLELRRKGFINCIKEQYPDILVEEVHENNEDPLIAKEWLISLINRIPDIRGVYVTEGATPWGVAEAAQSISSKKRIRVIAHDMAKETISYIEKGIIDATVNDNTYTQGYDPIIKLYNRLASDWEPGTAQQLVKMDFVTKENLNLFWSNSKGLLISQSTKDRLTVPAPRTNDNKIKIGVVSPMDSSFWEVVKNGVMDAKSKLRPYNCDVEWYEVPGSVNETGPYISLIKKAVASGCNAIATIVINSTLTPYINEITDRGIPVATFLTEPTSLRNLLYELNNQSGFINDLTYTARKHLEETTAETTKVIESVKEFSSGTKIQTKKFIEVQNEINSLKDDIEEINNNAIESSESNNKSVKSVTAGSRSVEASLKNIKEIEQSINHLWEIIEILTQESKGITTIVDIISDISEKINTLSINAAIESTRAGEHGKGFLVISGEIRKLASDTGKAALGITDIIDRIKVNVSNASDEISVGKEYVNESSSLSDGALRALTSINTMVDQDRARGIEIASAISRIKEIFEHVNQNMIHVTEISNGYTDSVETMSNSMGTVGEKLLNVKSLVLELEEIAKAGKTIMSSFTIN